MSIAELPGRERHLRALPSQDATDEGRRQVRPEPLERLRSSRTSIKWTRYPSDVLPLFVAEMDFPVAASIVDSLVRSVRASDTGYIDGAGPIAAAFAAFAADRWSWTVDQSRIHVATDVSVGIVETLRIALPAHPRVVVTPPVYPPFLELTEEAGGRVIEVPLAHTDDSWALDLTAIERAFREGADAFLLCNPHNPIGIAHDPDTLAALGRLAAAHDVLIVSDEVHAPLTHTDVVFTPFALAAEGAGARNVTVTSASKGWNIAGVKCALMIAGDERSAADLDRLPEEVACRTSILGIQAGVAAFACTDWLDEVVAAIEDNDALLAALLADQLPQVIYHRPDAGYLGWLDLRALGLGAQPAIRILEEARVALNDGASFGREGAGFARINFACAPETLREAVRRIAQLVASV